MPRTPFPRRALAAAAVAPAVATAAALVGPTGAAQPPAAAARPVRPGCYHVTLGRWSQLPSFGPRRPTTVVRLDTLPRGPGRPGDLAAERVEPAEFAPPGDPRLRWQRPSWWRREGGDSVEIHMWATGTEHEAFYGRRVGAAFRGVVRRTTDAIPVDPGTGRVLWNAWPWAAAAIEPVPCP